MTTLKSPAIGEPMASIPAHAFETDTHVTAPDSAITNPDPASDPYYGRRRPLDVDVGISGVSSVISCRRDAIETL